MVGCASPNSSTRSLQMQALVLTSCCSMAIRAGWAIALAIFASSFCCSLNSPVFVAPIITVKMQYYDKGGDFQKRRKELNACGTYGKNDGYCFLVFVGAGRETDHSSRPSRRLAPNIYILGTLLSAGGLSRSSLPALENCLNIVQTIFLANIAFVDLTLWWTGYLACVIDDRQHLTSPNDSHISKLHLSFLKFRHVYIPARCL